MSTASSSETKTAQPVAPEASVTETSEERIFTLTFGKKEIPVIKQDKQKESGFGITAEWLDYFTNLTDGEFIIEFEISRGERTGKGDDSFVTTSEQRYGIFNLSHSGDSCKISMNSIGHLFYTQVMAPENQPEKTETKKKKTSILRDYYTKLTDNSTDDYTSKSNTVDIKTDSQQHRLLGAWIGHLALPSDPRQVFLKASNFSLPIQVQSDDTGYVAIEMKAIVGAVVKNDKP